jgi:hypothetical protein
MDFNLEKCTQNILNITEEILMWTNSSKFSLLINIKDKNIKNVRSHKCTSKLAMA